MVFVFGIALAVVLGFGAGLVGFSDAGGAFGSGCGNNDLRQMGQVACSCSHGVMHDWWNTCSHSSRDVVSPEVLKDQY